VPDDNLPFRAEDEAMIKLGDATRAPVLSYDVPQPAEYNGRYTLELLLDDTIWNKAARPKPPTPANTGSGRDDKIASVARPDLVAANLAVSDRVLKGTLTDEDKTNERSKKPPRPGKNETEEVEALVDRYGEDRIAADLAAGGYVVERRAMDNTTYLDVITAPDPALARPRLAIVQSCRMSSFLGDYGAGRTINTFTLLPGERHEIEIKTYKRSKLTTTEASSILDSYESTTAEEFQSDLTTENSTQNSAEKNFSYHAEAEASASWGWGSAKVSGGVEGGKSSKTEEFAKNVASTTQKHAATAASKRQVEINTSSQSETEEGEETAIKRSIENINVGRTLNFVFRQMNQVFITVLHIVDVRIAFQNGDPAMAREYTLPDIDEMLEELIKPESRKTVRDALWQQLSTVFDWNGNHAPLAEAVKLKAGANGTGLTQSIVADPEKASFWRFKRQSATLDPLQDGAAVTVPGVVIGVTRSTLPTDGVVVDALLGQGNALDAYSMGLQMEAVVEKQTANARAAIEIEVLRAKLDAIADGDSARATLIAQLFPAPEPSASE
jgi:hypothetical protein